MTQITNFRNADFDALRNDIEAALAAVGEKHGISLAIGSISYNDTTATTKITMALGEGKDRRDMRLDKFAQDFKRYQRSFPTLKLNAKVMIRGAEYEIVGYNPRGRQYPLIVKKTSSGESYKFDIFTVERAVEAQAAKTTK